MNRTFLGPNFVELQYYKDEKFLKSHTKHTAGLDSRYENSVLSTKQEGSNVYYLPTLNVPALQTYIVSEMWSMYRLTCVPDQPK